MEQDTFLDWLFPALYRSSRYCFPRVCSPNGLKKKTLITHTIVCRLVVSVLQANNVFCRFLSLSSSNSPNYQWIQSWVKWWLLSHGREHVFRRLVCREWRRFPESTPLESLSTDSRPPFERGWVKSIEPTISIGRWPAGKSSIRKVECRMQKLASTMPKVGCRKRKLKGQILNVGCEKMNVHSTELEGRIWKLDFFLWKVECRKQKLECCINRSWMLNAKIESRVQTQMTNTKCRTDCAKYNVKWNIEFWRKWNAIVFNLSEQELHSYTNTRQMEVK